MRRLRKKSRHGGNLILKAKRHLAAVAALCPGSGSRRERPAPMRCSPIWRACAWCARSIYRPTSAATSTKIGCCGLAREGVHFLLQVRCAELDGRLETLFREWHPRFRLTPSVDFDIFRQIFQKFPSAPETV